MILRSLNPLITFVPPHSNLLLNIPTYERPFTWCNIVHSGGKDNILKALLAQLASNISDSCRSLPKLTASWSSAAPTSTPLHTTTSTFATTTTKQVTTNPSWKNPSLFRAGKGNDYGSQRKPSASGVNDVPNDGAKSLAERRGIVGRNGMTAGSQSTMDCGASRVKARSSRKFLSPAAATKTL